jgi:hypothetical protein
MESNEFNKDELRKLGAMIKSRLGGMKPYDKMFGTLCYNIWNHPSNKYLATNKLQDLKWTFACSLGVYALWDDLKISKVYDLNKIVLQAPEQTSKEVGSIIEFESDWYNSLQQDKPLLDFITLFEAHLRNKWGNGNTSSREYFQRGIEILLFLNLRAMRLRPDIYESMQEQARCEPDIKSICQDLDAAF